MYALFRFVKRRNGEISFQAAFETRVKTGKIGYATYGIRVEKLNFTFGSRQNNDVPFNLMIIFIVLDFRSGKI